MKLNKHEKRRDQSPTSPEDNLYGAAGKQSEDPAPRCEKCQPPDLANGVAVNSGKANGHTEQKNAENHNPKVIDRKFLGDKIGDNSPDQGFVEKRKKTDPLPFTRRRIFLFEIAAVILKGHLGIQIRFR